MIEEKKNKTYGDYLKRAADLDPAYRGYIKNYRKDEDIVFQPSDKIKNEKG